MRALGWICAAALAASCLGPEDRASNAHDLRVLGVRCEPPEFMRDPARPAIPVFELQALVVDPSGGGRAVQYEYSVCPSAGDLRCPEGDAFTFKIGAGTVVDEIAGPVRFVATQLPDLEAFLEEAIKKDPYKGFGGIRPVVTLRITAGDEVLYAGKRLVISEKMHPDQRPNVNPPAPQLTIDGAVADAGRVVGRDPAPELDIAIEPAAKEQYLVQTFDMQWLTLTESFRVSWVSTKGSFRPEQGGGAEFTGATERPTKSELAIDEFEPAGPFSVYAIVRDGRGGESWTRLPLEYAAP